jgi:hypothetical protein
MLEFEVYLALPFKRLDVYIGLAPSLVSADKLV